MNYYLYLAASIMQLIVFNTFFGNFCINVLHAVYTYLEFHSFLLGKNEHNLQIWCGHAVNLLKKIVLWSFYMQC